MRSRFLPLSALLGLMAASGAALAQQGSAELRGRVLDAQQSALPGATVVARNQDTGMFRQVVSNQDGTYFLSDVVPGLYEVSAELTGFKRYARRGVRLEIGKTATLDITLELGALEEQLTVTAVAPVVDVTSKEVGANITARELTDLPSINRNFIGLIGVVPGIIPNVSTESFGSDSITDRKSVV